MRNLEILKLQLRAIVSSADAYNNSSFTLTILQSLLKALDDNNYEIIVYCCEEIHSWYINEIENTIEYSDDTDLREEHESNCRLLEEIINDLKSNEKDYRQLFATLSTATSTSHNLTESTLKLIIDKFDGVVVQLRDRHDNRDTLDVSDEYDVQDLLRSLLSIYCDDIRTEEWTPSYAGTSSRQDFLLKKEKIVIETKKTRKGLGNRELADELIIDMKRYKTHPDCNELVCFIYDPERRIKNPRGFENDLSNDKEHPKVKVYIRP